MVRGIKDTLAHSKDYNQDREVSRSLSKDYLQSTGTCFRLLHYGVEQKQNKLLNKGIKRAITCIEILNLNTYLLNFSQIL